LPSSQWEHLRQSILNKCQRVKIAISKYVTAQQNPALGDEAKIKAAIDAYFTLRYEGQRLLRSQDFSTLAVERQTYVVLIWVTWYSIMLTVVGPMKAS